MEIQNGIKPRTAKPESETSIGPLDSHDDMPVNYEAFSA